MLPKEILQFIPTAQERLKGKSPQEVQKYVLNAFQAKGININQMAQRLGLRMPNN